MDLNEAAEVSAGRSSIYGMLAAIYRSELTADTLRELRSSSFLDALSDLGAQLDDEFLETPEDRLLEDLAVEYARLFIGPGKHISPHESVHHEREDGQWGTLWGPSTVEVKKFIESAGLHYKPEYRGLPDHISVELEFMREVVLKESEAWRNGNREDALRCLKIEKKFMEEHILKWLPKLCDRVMEQAKLPFYRAMAGLTKSFVELERETISMSCDQE